MAFIDSTAVDGRLISVYQTAFPEVDQVRVQNDLRIALQALLDRGLIVLVS